MDELIGAYALGNLTPDFWKLIPSQRKPQLATIID